MAFHGASWSPHVAAEAREGHGHHECHPCGGTESAAHGCQRQVELTVVAQMALRHHQEGLTRSPSTWNAWAILQDGEVVACGTTNRGGRPLVLVVGAPGDLLPRWDAPSSHPCGQPLTHPLEAWKTRREPAEMAAAVLLLTGCAAMGLLVAAEGVEALAAAAAAFACSDDWPSAPSGPAWQPPPAAAAC